MNEQPTPQQVRRALARVERGARLDPAEATVLHAGDYGRERHYKIGHFDIYRGAGFRQSSADQIAFFHEHLTPDAMETRRRERGRAKREERSRSPISLR